MKQQQFRLNNNKKTLIAQIEQMIFSAPIGNNNHFLHRGISSHTFLAQNAF